MELRSATKDILGQLKLMIDGLDNEIYSTPLPVLHGSSIGQHTRHILEFYVCLFKDCLSEEKIVNYDKRKRNLFMETETEHAANCLDNVLTEIDCIKENAKVIVDVNYSIEDESTYSIESCYHRELAFNIEHAIHHMALIKIGLDHVDHNLDLPTDFGIARSTIKHQNKATVKA